MDGAVEPRDCPYFGLDYYRERFGAWFFGRDAERDKIITNLQAARLTLLHAESGVGKSSLLRAGVAWQLRRARREPGLAGAGVPVVFSSWQDDPVPGLAGAIREATQPLAGRPEPELPADRLDAAIEAAVGAVDATLLVILDQFEEYFLYRSREPAPGRFAGELARCINRADLPANFLIAIREDAYAGLGELFKGRIANVYGNYLHIGYLTTGRQRRRRSGSRLMSTTASPVFPGASRSRTGWLRPCSTRSGWMTPAATRSRAGRRPRTTATAASRPRCCSW